MNPTNTTPASSVKSTPPQHSVLCTPSLSVNVTLPLSVKSTPALHGVLYTPKLSVLHGTTDAHHIWCAVSTFVLRVQGYKENENKGTWRAGLQDKWPQRNKGTRRVGLQDKWPQRNKGTRWASYNKRTVLRGRTSNKIHHK